MGCEKEKKWLLISRVGKMALPNPCPCHNKRQLLALLLSHVSPKKDEHEQTSKDTAILDKASDRTSRVLERTAPESGMNAQRPSGSQVRIRDVRGIEVQEETATDKTAR